jgi:hypothetical protein
MVTPASIESSGIHASAALAAPSTKSRMITTKPAAFGATESQATNGVLPAS